MKPLEHIRKEVRKHEDVLKKMLAKFELLATRVSDKRFLKIISKEKQKVVKTLENISQSSISIYPVFKRELKKKTIQLETKLERLNKAKDALVSDNYLLEYKKKELLILTDKLEEAYEEISAKNVELLRQQVMIQQQSEKLSAIHREILAKNEELEIQKEALLDQSDYLYEANETITQMHQEVEKQKDEILQKNAELLTINNEKNNLIGIVAHDLKSPLHQINGLIKVLKMTEKNLSSESLGYLDLMERSTGRLSDMIAKILDVEAIDAKKVNLKIVEVHLPELLEGVIKRYAMSADNKRITIQSDIEECPTVALDYGYTEQILDNLLSNAIKFSPPRTTVDVRLRNTFTSVICEIRDEGPGLTEEDKKKLFGKYQKLSAKPTGNETSTGLGLSIVRKFAEAMGGQIWCESIAGKGASFFVSFPVNALS